MEQKQGQHNLPPRIAVPYRVSQMLSSPPGLRYGYVFNRASSPQEYEYSDPNYNTYSNFYNNYDNNYAAATTTTTKSDINNSNTNNHKNDDNDNNTNNTDVDDEFDTHTQIASIPDIDNDLVSVTSRDDNDADTDDENIDMLLESGTTIKNIKKSSNKKTDDANRQQIDDSSKKVNKRKKKEELQEFQWMPDDVEKLIRLWESKEELYRVDSPHYLERGQKSIIIRCISNQLGIPENDVLKKMKSLQTYWQSIKNKLKGKSGDSAKKLKKWVYFENLDFLNRHMASSSTVGNLDPATTSSHSTGDVDNISDSSVKITGRRKREDQQEKHNRLLERAVASFEKGSETAYVAPTPAPPHPDEDQQFGDLITTKMRKIPDCDIKEDMKLEILQLINRCARQQRDNPNNA